ATPVPTISPAEMQILISRSGLVLNPGQMADLVLAWRQVAGLIASIPQDRPFADDMASSFRLTPPDAAAPAAHATAKSGPVSKPAVRPPAKAAAGSPKPAGRKAAKTASKPSGKGSGAAAKSRARAKPKAKARRPAVRRR